MTSTVHTRDINIVHVPRGLRLGCRSKRVRIRKKLAKRWGVYHLRDARHVTVHHLRDCSLKSVTFDPQRQEHVVGVDLAEDPSADQTVKITLERSSGDDDLLEWFREVTKGNE